MGVRGSGRRALANLNSCDYLGVLHQMVVGEGGLEEGHQGRRDLDDQQPEVCFHSDSVGCRIDT